jgi:hypothetical protein
VEVRSVPLIIMLLGVVALPLSTFHSELSQAPYSHA